VLFLSRWLNRRFGPELCWRSLWLVRSALMCSNDRRIGFGQACIEPSKELRHVAPPDSCRLVPVAGWFFVLGLTLLGIGILAAFLLPEGLLLRRAAAQS